MTKPKGAYFLNVYKKEIIWLEWYFKRDKVNPKNTKLEQLIEDAEKNLHKDNGSYQDNYIELKKFRFIKLVLDNYLKECEDDILTAIIEIFVNKSINVQGAAISILYMSQTQSYVHINQFFKDLENKMFEMIEIDLGVEEFEKEKASYKKSLNRW